MASFGQLKLTTRGVQAQVEVQNGGTPLKFTKIGMGSGVFNGDSTSLINLVKEEVAIAIEKSYVQDNIVFVSGTFANENLVDSFIWREIGLYFEDENGNDILYCYANAKDKYDVIPATADERYTKTVRIATAFSNAEHVTIVVGSGVNMVETGPYEEWQQEVARKHKEYDAHVASKENPHGVTAEQIGALSKTGGTLTGKVTSATSQTIPFVISRSDKKNADLDWSQDLQFSNADGTRTAMARAQVNSAGNRLLILGVSNSSNVAPVGISIIRNEKDNYVYAEAPVNAFPGTKQICNTYAGTTALTAGSSALENNCVYQMYE